MKRIALTILTTIFFSFLLLFPTQSQPPTPSNSKISEEQQNKPAPKKTLTETEQNTTNNSSSAIPQVGTAYTNYKKTNQTKDSDQKATHDRSLFDLFLVIFTGLLALSTFLLWWSTRKLWKSTQAAFVAANRPRLRIRGIFSDSGILPNRVHIANVGGTNATDIVVHAAFARKSGNVREAPWIENLSKSVWHGPNKLASGEEGMYELKSKPDISVDSLGDMLEINTRRKTVLMIGEARYTDANETERKTGFGWSYDTTMGEFSKPEKEDQYNYED